MRTPLGIALAAGLLVALSSAAMAQQSAPRNGYRNAPQVDRNYSYEQYGLGASCENRPFAPGCDKRGVW